MRQTLLSLLALALMLAPNRVDAWSSKASNTYQRTKRAEMVVNEYRQDSGKLPDAHNCWDLIRKDSRSIFTELPDAFVDSWKQELVYKAPGLHGEFDVYSVGADGIDSQGGGDDISNWGGVNEGYYWKRFWPLGRSSIIASCVIGSCFYAQGEESRES